MAVEKNTEENSQETYLRWGLTDPDAPVQAGGEIIIDADQQTVWNILTDVSGWPRLRTDINRVSADGPVRKGASCWLETAGITLQITFGLVDAPREVVWVTTTPGLTMTNRYSLGSEGGSTRVMCRETLLAPSFPQFDEAELSGRIKVWLQAIKQIAEAVGNPDGHTADSRKHKAGRAAAS